MSQTNPDRDKIERLMKAARLPGPSDALKTRVIEATQKAWRRDSIDIPVRILLRRLVASVAAAVIVVALADRYGNRAMSAWQPGDLAAVHQKSADLQTLLESTHSIAALPLRHRERQSSSIDASTLRGHLERVREILDEAQGDPDSKSSTSVGGQSGMIPTRPDFDLYSREQIRGTFSCAKERHES